MLLPLDMSVFMADKRIFDPKLSQGSGGFNNILGSDIQIPIGSQITINTQGSASLIGNREDTQIGSFGSFGISKNVPKGFGGGLSLSAFQKTIVEKMGF